MCPGSLSLRPEQPVTGLQTPMPKRLITKIRRMLGGQRSSTKSSARIYPRDTHEFRPERFHTNALQVVDKLHQAGYEAYLVGGCVRDGLLGMEPKDFDVATSARPEQVKALFRNCQLIGRRFRLAHVRFGREIIEVATFRGHHDNAASEDQSVQSAEGMLLRDNVYGTLEEDALRRDFTANALYYRHHDHCILDFASGVEDIQHRQLRLLGDPETRYREDPVRMLRAIRFAAKLQFNLTPETERPIREHAELLARIPAARLFEEILKLFTAGYATEVWRLLEHYHLARYLFPASVADVNHHPGAQGMIEQIMINTDQRIADGKSVTPAFLYAVMLWGPLQERWSAIKADGIPAAPAFQQAMQQVIQAQARCTSIPKRFVIPLREMWELQLRLPLRHGKRAEQLVEHARFRAAYDLLLLREQAGETEAGLGDWWHAYQFANPNDRKTMVEQLTSKGSGTGKRRRRRRNPKMKAAKP